MIFRYVVYTILVVETCFILLLLDIMEQRLFSFFDMRTAYHDGCQLGNRSDKIDCSEIADYFIEELIRQITK